MFDRVEDSGERRETITGSRRDVRKGKGRFDLIPFYPLERLAQHYENGAVKYGDRNWEKGQPLSWYLDSGLRHALKWVAGMTDEDHASAAVWNIFGFLWTQEQIRLGNLPKELNDVEQAEESFRGILPFPRILDPGDSDPS